MDIVKRFMSLFEGLPRFYGTYKITGKRASDGKLDGRGYPHYAPVTELVWKEHILGVTMLGITPINDDQPEGKVKWGLIDADIYDIDHVAVLKLIKKLKLPLVGSRTKSGGLHLWLFLEDWTSSKLVRLKLAEYKALLGWGGHDKVEIFPMQTCLNQQQKNPPDTGSWVNMPYFAAEQTTRYGYDIDGKALNSLDWLAYAEACKISEEYLLKFKVIEDKKHFPDGPPCLQHLATYGIGEGMRNNGLLAMGVYCKKAFPDSWEKELERYNQEYLKPPLGSGEVQQTIQGLRKKDYYYPCKKAPLEPHCNGSVCRGRKFGVGEGEDSLQIVSLTKILTDPPIWLVETERGKIKMDSEDLQSQQRFQLRTIAAQSYFFPLMKREAWQSYLQPFMDKAHIIEMPPEVTPQGQLAEYLEMFCKSKVTSDVVDDLLVGRPFHDKDKRCYMFRLKDLREFLERRKFKMDTNQLTFNLSQLGGRNEGVRAKKSFVRVWIVPDYPSTDEPHPVPKDIEQSPY